MRVLWASPFLPDPNRGGGHSHAWELLAHASRCHAVTLLCLELGPEEKPRALLDLGVEPQGVSWHPHLPASRGSLVWEALRGPGSEHFRSVLPGVRTAADLLVAMQERYDLAFIWGSELAPLVSVARIPTAYYITDAHTTYHRRLIGAAPKLRHRFLYALDAAHVRRWERTRYRSATALATTSCSEAAVLERLTNRHFEVVPIAAGDSWFTPPEIPRERNLVTIIAGLDYWPNIDGIRWFLREGWPRISTAMPEARLRVVGRSPVPELRAILDRADVELVADVPDARPYYWSASVVVMPLRVGSGVKNKLIHAFASGAPVVGTTVAIEGTPASPGTHALVADDPRALADAVIEVLRRPGQAARRAQVARTLAEAYRAQRAAEALESFWQHAAFVPLGSEVRRSITPGSATAT